MSKKNCREYLKNPEMKTQKFQFYHSIPEQSLNTVNKLKKIWHFGEFSHKENDLSLMGKFIKQVYMKQFIDM